MPNILNTPDALAFLGAFEKTSEKAQPFSGSVISSTFGSKSVTTGLAWAMNVVTGTEDPAITAPAETMDIPRAAVSEVRN